jgi:hypothetical protein
MDGGLRKLQERKCAREKRKKKDEEEKHTEGEGTLTHLCLALPCFPPLRQHSGNALRELATGNEEAGNGCTAAA